MNLERSLLFSYIEEDNIQKAYFRVHPLLTVTGDIRAEALERWPNEGCLRIVPDRNELHTFKGRMRSLGSWCVVDLTNQAPDTGKIRTNKNYHPDNGEVNQYILYSDTVHTLPEHSFYHILPGRADAFAEAAQSAITPLFFLRDGDTLFGPVRREAPELPSTAPECEGMLVDLPCPDGVMRQLLCVDDGAVSAEVQTAEPSQEPAPAAVPVAAPAEPVPEPEPTPEAQTSAPAVQEEESLPIAQSLTILDQSAGFEETLQRLDKPLSKGANLLNQRESRSSFTQQPQPKTAPLGGTPLVRTPVHTSQQQPKNRTQEVVSSQLVVRKYEPPTQNLPEKAALRDVVNPVEQACRMMREAWHSADARPQLTEFILSLEGVRTQLERQLCQNRGESVLQHVLQTRLQDLEAERLTALCELDRARRDAEAYRTSVMNDVSARLKKETAQLEANRNDAQSQLDTLKSEITAMSAQRDALIARLDELHSVTMPAAVAQLLTDAQMLTPTAGVPLRMAPVPGRMTSRDELIDRVMAICAASGTAIDRNTAIALLALLAICPRIGVSCSTVAPAVTLIHNLMTAMGWDSGFAHQIAPEQKPSVTSRPVDSTPAILMTSLPNFAPLTCASKLLMSRNVLNLTRNPAYDASQWPVLSLPNLPYVPEQGAANAAPVSEASLKAFVSDATVPDEQIQQALAPVLAAASPLSGQARQEMFRFISACADMMEGGLPAAADWAVLLWLLPGVDRGPRSHTFKALLDEYPLSLSHF